MARACDLIARDAGRRRCRRGSVWRRRGTVRAEVVRLMDGDVKATGLKELQGLIWQEGYAAGRLRSHVYADVPPALRRWSEAGLDLRIFSSGSIAAQKVFFAHTEAGDLLGLFRGHYDTTTGPSARRRAIAASPRTWGCRRRRSFFQRRAAGAGRGAGGGDADALVVRPGNAPVAAGHGHGVVTDLEQLTAS